MPTPQQLAKSGSEHGEQTALFAWANMARLYGFQAANDDRCYTEAGWALARYGPGREPDHAPVPELQWFHAVHNQGHGDKIRGGMAKAEGVKRGVLDTFLPVRRGQFSGLYIEMKPLKSGALTEEQKEFKDFVLTQGFGAIMCRGWRAAADILTQYLTGE